MRYIHFRDDFSIEERFFTDDGNGGKVAIAVPERVEIEFFTVQGRTRFVARRNGSEFENCELSADGKTLTVFVSLRNKPIGHGRLLRLVTQISEDASFPDGLKYTRFPGREDAVLYLGKSDGPLDLTSEIVFGLGGVTLDRVWQSLQNNTDYPGEKIHLEHIPALPISGVIGLQDILDELSREIPSIDDFTIGIGDATISPGDHASLTEIGVPEWAQNAELAFSDLPDMYIGSARVMGSAQTAQDVGGLGNLTASGLIKTTNYLQGTRLILADGVYLEYDSASQGVKLVGAGLWTESYLTAGGEGSSSGGGGGIDIDRLWQSLTNNPADQGYENTKIAIAHIPALPISGVIGLQDILDELSREIPSIDDFTIGIGDATISPGNHASLTEIGVPEWAQNAELAFSDLPAMYIGSAKVMDSEQAAQDVGGLKNITASGLIKTTNYLQGTRLILADGVYLEYDSASQGVKLVGAGFWTESYVTAGGTGSSGGGEGIDIDRLWQSLTNNPADQGYENTKIAIAHIPSLPISGVIGLQSALDGKQDAISDLATIRSNSANGATAYSWGNHANAGYLTSANGTTISAALQSLQAQIDSVATRDMFDELKASALYADMAAVSNLYVGTVSLNGVDLAGTLSSLSSRASSLEGRASTLEGYFTGGVANSAAKLTTVSKTAWGQTYWTSGGVPDSISGNMSSVGSISMNGSISGATSITASGLIKTTNYVQATRFYLTDSIYFVADSNGVKLEGAGFYTDSFVTAGGVGSGGGGGDMDIDRMWQSLTNNPADAGYENTKIAQAHIPDMATTYGYLKTITGAMVTAALGYTPFNNASFTQANIKSTLGIYDWALASTKPGYSVSEISGLQAALDGKQATISDLATIRSNASAGATAYGWGNHANAGYLTSANGTTISAALQSLQAQIDSAATRDMFDELKASALYADMAAVSNLYVGTVSLNGADLAGTLSSLSSRASLLDGRASTLESFFTGGVANSAAKLTTVSKTAWGQTYWTSGGVPTNVSGNMSSVGSISMNGSISGATSITASGLVKTTNYLQGARLILADGVYLEYDSASQGVKLVGAGLWTESYVTAGGEGSSSGGGGGIDIDRLWQSLTNNPADQGYENTKIAVAHIPDTASTYGYLKSITASMVTAALGYTPFNSASFTKANIKSTLGISDWALAASKPGYSVSEISGLQAALNAKQDTISDLATIRSNAANGATAYGWGNHANAGYLTSANGTTISAALQSLQAQIDSVATKDVFDELKASALYADMAAVSNLYVGTVSLNGVDLAGTLSSLSSRASSLEGRASTLEGYFTGGVANSAAKLTTVSKTAWGQTYWTSGGVPTNVSGNMSSVGSISMNGSISGATSITASGLVKTMNYLQGARLILADGVYLEYDSASQGVKLVGAGLWTESYVTAGGEGSSSGGGGGIDIDRLWQSLTNNPADQGYENTKIAQAHIPDMATTYGYLKGNQTITLTGVVTGSGTTSIATSIADGALTIAKVSGLQAALDSKTGNTGTVTSVGLSVPTGLSVSGSPVSTSGTLAITFASGYSIPTTAQQSAWSGKQDAISDLATIRNNAANGATAYSWGNHASAGYLTSANGTTISQALQSLQSQVDSIAARDMFDELSVTVLNADMLTATSAYIGTVNGSLSGNATTASYLVSASYGVGGGLNPVYFSGGRPVASTSTAGSASVPVYLNGGTLTAITPSSLFSALSSSAATNLSVTIAGQGRTIADLYARYDKDGGEIAPNMTTIGTALRSLQSQVDSVASRNAFDELTATVLFSDMLSVGGDAMVGGLATVAGGLKLTTTKKIWFDDTHYIELLNGYLHTNLPIVSDSYITAGAANTNA